mmetsp:Transcript_21266/g.38805  ORF Transcript_21266/g.38805 Transcript_21266/m.38805 type:complete len:366 (+) Transcript_21266:65-1162(+)
MGHEKEAFGFNVMKFFTGGRPDDDGESKSGADPMVSPAERRSRIPGTPSVKAESSPTRTPISPAFAAFEIADDLEKGFADEVPQLSKVCSPAPKTNQKLSRYCIFQNEARPDEYQLVSEDGDALLDAKVLRREQCIEIYTGDRGRSSSSGGSPENRKRPAFIMSFHEQSDEWIVTQSTCDRCSHRPHHLTCAYMGKGQQVARIQHSRKLLKDKDARVHNVDVYIPPLTNEQSTPWCPVLCGRDLGSSCPASPSRSPQPRSPTRSPVRRSESWRSQELFDLEPIHLCSKLPIWDDVVQSLVLNFEARMISSSARNFMLRQPEEGDATAGIIFQHAKMAKGSYCLDFKHPLNAVQAFALALSSERWD